MPASRAFAIEEENSLAHLSPTQIKALRELCTHSQEHFMRMFFKLREGTTLKISGHHGVLHRVLQRVYNGEIRRLIINMPPGYTKTEEAVIGFIAGGLARNPRAKFIHASYSGDLANENSRKVKDTVLLPEFQTLWPMALRTDSKATNKWYTQYGGGMLAAPSGGQITGFRAGRMEDGFTGALIIDDPLKPDDAYSEPKRKKINQRYNSTMKSRLATEDVPVVVIMQRLHEEDLTGWLLKGGSGEKWHHLELPVMVGEDMDVPEEWTHRIPVDHDLPDGPLWEDKHDEEQIELLKVDPYNHASQYMQRPSPLGGGVFKDEWWEYYDEVPDLKFQAVYVDTAQKVKQHNDYSVFIHVGLTRDDRLCILDLLRDKWEAPELLTSAEEFWNKSSKYRSLGKRGAKIMKIEDKSSGTGLIQQLKKKLKSRVMGIPRDKDKVQRAMGCVPEFHQGKVLLPSGPNEFTDASWVSDYKTEFRRFTPLMTHAHDDQIDPTLDAVEDLLINNIMSLYDNL